MIRRRVPRGRAGAIPLPEQIARLQAVHDADGKTLCPRVASRIRDREIKAATSRRGLRRESDHAACQRGAAARDIRDGKHRRIAETRRVTAQINARRGRRAFQHEQMRHAFEMQILLQPRVGRRIARGEIGRARDRSVVILHRAVPAESAFIIVRHAIAVGIDRCRRRGEAAKAAPRHSQLRFARDHVPRLVREIAHQPRIHLIPHRARVGRIQPQRAAAGNELLIRPRRRLHIQHRRARHRRHTLVIARKIRRGGHIRHHLRRIVFLPLHDVVTAIRAIEHAVAIDVVQIAADMHGEVRPARGIAIQPALLQRPAADVSRRTHEVIAHHIRLPRGGRV